MAAGNCEFDARIRRWRCTWAQRGHRVPLPVVRCLSRCRLPPRRLLLLPRRAPLLPLPPSAVSGRLPSLRSCCPAFLVAGRRALFGRRRSPVRAGPVRVVVAVRPLACPLWTVSLRPRSRCVCQYMPAGVRDEACRAPVRFSQRARTQRYALRCQLWYSVKTRETSYFGFPHHSLGSHGLATSPSARTQICVCA